MSGNENKKEVHVETAKMTLKSNGNPVVVSVPRVRETLMIKFTHYCNCKKCTGKSPGDKGYGYASDGTKTVSGTLAAPKGYPYGTSIAWTDPQGAKRNGVVHDRGGAIKGNRIDIWVASHDDAIRLGVYTVEAVVIKPNN